MGQEFSHPVSAACDTGGLVCMVLRKYDKYRVLHAPKEVVDLTARVVG